MLTTIWTYDTKVEWFHVQDQLECVSTPREQQNGKGILHARNNTAQTFQ